MPRRKQASIPDALLDQLLDGTDPPTAFNPDGVIEALKKALAERMLNAEMNQDIKQVPVLIDRSPEIMQLAPDPEEHFIQTPFILGVRATPLEGSGQLPAKN